MSESTLASPVAQEHYATLSDRRIRASRMIGRIINYLALIFLSIIYLLPFWWMLITSVKTLEETFRVPPTLFPQSFTLIAYEKAWGYLPWTRFLGNTLTIVFGGLIGILLTCTLCAYGFSRISFPGRDLVFIIMLASMMLPGQVTLIPTYVFFRELNWLNTFKPLIVPAWFGGGAFNIFLMRQFFSSIPAELVDAAYIDGCSRLGIWWRIMLPLSKPALTAITVFTIQGRWNDFFGPLIYLNSMDKLTLSLGLQMFQQLASSGTDYSEIGLYTAMMAASAVVTLPMIILFISAQKYFVQGIQMTGLKF